ncbi:MAG: extracellular solute-binding protein, partial [Deinococcota bacterium]
DAGGTIDLSPYLEEGFADDFFDAAWTIVSYDSRPFGIPFVTDTHALFYNVDYINQAGINVPQSMDECWSWQEFSELSRTAMDNSDADYGHAALWNAKRWLLFLYGNGGQVLNDDLTASTMNADAAIETIAWTKSWYYDGLTPLSTSMKLSERAEELFINGSIAFFISGSWHLPSLRENMLSYGWDVTYLPCTENGQDADLGGNGFAVTKDSDHPEIAAEFIKFMTNTDNMRRFASEAFFNPVRNSSLEGLEYPEFNEQMLLFAEVAATVDAHHAAVQGLPIFPQLATAMADELDLAFVGVQSADRTAQNIHDKITAILADQ